MSSLKEFYSDTFVSKVYSRSYHESICRSGIVGEAFQRVVRVQEKGKSIILSSHLDINNVDLIINSSYLFSIFTKDWSL